MNFNAARSAVRSNTAYLAVVVIVAVVPGRSLRAADGLLGAGAAMKKVAEATVQPLATTPAASPADALRKDLETFRASAATLAPAEAAKQWLALADRVIAQPPDQNFPTGRRLQRVAADDWLRAMPPPAAWLEFARAVQARPAATGTAELRELGLHLLAATLNNDVDGRNRAIAAIQARAEKAGPRQSYLYRNFLTQVNEALIEQLDDPDAVLKSLERQLAGFQDRNSYNRLNIPNLVPLAGSAKAEGFLRKALVHPNAEFELPEGTATSALAQQLALELMDQLKRPHWNLVNSLSALGLYEAMDKKFGPKTRTPPATAPAIPGLPDLDLPDSGPSDYQRRQAQAYYLLGLISKERTKDAVVVALDLGKDDYVDLPHDAMKAMELAGYTKAVDAFLHELLTQHPELPFWNEYVSIAAKAGETDRMVALVRTVSQRPDLTKTQKANVQQWLPRALLAADQIEAGVAELRNLIATKSQATRAGRGSMGESAASLALQLARIGQHLGRAEWTEEGITATRQALGRTADPEMMIPGQEPVEAISLARLLQELKRPAEAEGVLIEALIRAGRTTPNAARSSYMGSPGDRVQFPLLAALAALYQQLGRPADVLVLLDQNPDWGLKDLANSLDGRFGSSRFGHTDGSETPPIVYEAAAALAGAGRTTDAGKLVNALLDRQPGLDAAYELLLKVGGDTIPARLDELYARDRYEERPLIWKAHWLRLNNRLAEAEPVARQAIAIDPSDGEQGPGDRLRAYAVLADIREARGDAAEARQLRSAVGAIRLSETADRFLASGLIKRALEMYRDSLKQFADAYCIQSRLAIQLSELGLHAEAEEHYRRAYELMPESFGRVESHCFGCERAFDGERAQGVAEKVFTQLAVKTPNKPQVHYLLGYLREEQGRYPEAIKHFQKAVELDPEYLNAWKKISENSVHAHLPVKERTQVTLNILRLDPLERHCGVNLGGVTDLAALWAIAQSASSRQPPVIESLYPLPASRAALEKLAAERAKQPGNGFDQDAFIQRENRVARTPGRLIAESTMVRLSGELIAPAYSGGEEE